jgi:hypothetical protein
MISKEVTYNGKTYTISQILVKDWELFSTELEKVIIDFYNSMKTPWYVKLWQKVFKKEKMLVGELGEYGRMFEILLGVLKRYPSKLTHLLFLATNISEDELKKGSLEDMYNLILEVWELNNLKAFFLKVLKEMQPKRPTQKTQE